MVFSSTRITIDLLLPYHFIGDCYNNVFNGFVALKADQGTFPNSLYQPLPPPSPSRNPNLLMSLHCSKPLLALHFWPNLTWPSGSPLKTHLALSIPHLAASYLEWSLLMPCTSQHLWAYSDGPLCFWPSDIWVQHKFWILLELTLIYFSCSILVLLCSHKWSVNPPNT